MTRKKTSKAPSRPFVVAKRAVRAGAEMGRTGLRQFGGIISEEWLAKLEGERGRRVYREMADNDPTIGAMLFAVEMLLRNVDWHVEPWSDDAEHVEQADFASSLIDDMEHTFEDFTAEALTMLVYGWSACEIVYKLRGGPEEKDANRRSQHDDGKVGWRKLAPRAQDALGRWEFDDHDQVLGLHHQPITSPTVYIPAEKLLLFKTTSKKSNPEGRSMLRNAFMPWYRKRRIEECEAIGVERDLAGMPLFYVPPETFDTDDPEQVQKLANFQQAGESIKSDEQSCLILPSIFDANGNRLLEFTLAGTGSRRLFDTVAIADKYDKQIARCVLADFIFLGGGKVGSFALSSDKTEMFATAIGAWQKEIATVLNRQALPRLWALNGWNAGECPEFVPGDIEQAEVVEFANAMAQLTGAGWLTPGHEVDEAAIRARLDLPEVDPAELDALREERAALAATAAEPGEGEPKEPAAEGAAQ